MNNTPKKKNSTGADMLIKIANKIVQRIPKNLSYKKWVRISVGLIVFGACFAFTKPVFLQAIIRYLYVGTPGHYVRWKHESKQKFTYKLYLWNITNPAEFAMGKERPKLAEVGPYVFQQRKQKVNPVDDEADDTVSFNYWNVYRFSPKLSKPLTGEEIVTTLNLVLIAAMVKVKLELPHLMGLAVESMDVIYKNPKSIFTTMRAIDFIDKGYEIDCDQKVLAAKMACKEFKQSKGIRIVDADANLLRHRWFDLINDTLTGRYTVLRGSRNVLDVGRVTLIDGEPILKVYKDQKQNRCNVVNGTDKMYFAPFQQKNDILWIHDISSCKSFPLRLKKMKRVHGVKAAYKFYNPMDPLMNPECECNKFSGCAPRGMTDLFYCLGSFISASTPHFYLSDPKLQDTIVGLNPLTKRHETGIYFDLLSSGPIAAYERFQLNYLVTKIPEYPILSSIAKDVWLPVLWYEESYSIPIMDLGLIIGSIISKMTGVAAGYVFMFIGMVIGAILLAKDLQQRMKNLPDIIIVEPVDEKNDDTKDTKEGNDVEKKEEDKEQDVGKDVEKEGE